MARRFIEDTICVTVPTSADTIENRWWEIRQPVPSVAFALQGKFSAALGPRLGEAVHSLLRLSAAAGAAPTDDDGASEEAQDFRQDVETMGESFALSVFRRARAGRGLVDPGEPLNVAGDRLRAVLGWVVKHTGVELHAAELYGDFERQKDNLAHKWTKASLLHRLLLSSELKFLGDGPKPVSPSGADGDSHLGDPLFRAVNTGSITGFVSALDELLISPEELALLSVWALVHLLRPF